MADIRFHPLVARLYDPVQAYFEHVQGPPHRRFLAEGLRGDVLEVGVGTGAMFPYYAAHGAEGVRLVGVEPDAGMWRQAVKKADAYDVSIDIACARVEALPFDDARFDVVVESGLLCSVPDRDAALAEIARVLRPDGEFRFFDHVRSPGVVGRTQDALTPLWRRIAGNCHLNREVRPLIERSAEFDLRHVERHTVGHWPIREFVRGVATPGDE